MAFNLMGTLGGAVVGFLVGWTAALACFQFSTACHDAMGIGLVPFAVMGSVGMLAGWLTGSLSGATACRLGLHRLGATGARGTSWLVFALDLVVAIVFLELSSDSPDPEAVVNSLIYLGLFGLAVPLIAYFTASRQTTSDAVGPVEGNEMTG
jgi:hypothetical protein